MENRSLSIIIRETKGGKLLEETLNGFYGFTLYPTSFFFLGNFPEKLCKDLCKERSLSYERLLSDPDKTEGALLNEVLKEVHTPYVMFLKEGDRLEMGFLRNCMDVLTEQDEIPLAMGRSFFSNPEISNKKSHHVLSKRNIKKKELEDVLDEYGDPVYDRTVDTKEDPGAILISIDSGIFLTSAVKQIGFSEKLSWELEEDFILRFLLQFPKYLAVPEATYYYRDPRLNHALYYTGAHDKKWYTDSLEDFLFPLLHDAKKRYGKIPGFLQNYCMFYVNCRFMANLDNRNKKVLLGKDLDHYLDRLKALFLQLDDYYLLNQDNLSYITKSPERKCMFLRIKYGKVDYDYRVVTTEEGEKDLEMYFHDHLITKLSSHRFSINVMNYIDGKLWIDGSLISVFQYGNVKFFADLNREYMPVDDTHAYSQTKFFGRPAYRRLTYHLSFSLRSKTDLQRITFYASYHGEEFQMKISFANHWAKLSKSPRYSYWRFADRICYHAENGILIKKATKGNVFKREIQLQLNLLRYHKNELPFHWLYLITHPYFKKKKIWLMLDKLYKGGDSAEYFYRYCAGFDDGITKYYLIDEDTEDFKKLIDDGYEPLLTGSLKAKLVFLNADIVLITNSHVFPFLGYTKASSRFIRGYCNFGTMCLQHGLSVQKCAMAQRRIIDNTMMYFLGSKYEKDNLQKPAYGYEGFDMLKLTGIGRYDGLVNNDKRQILISPTWRMYNALPVTTSEGKQRGYNPEFKHTTYFRIYNELINDRKLIETAKKCGYKIKYLLHPIISSQAEDFTPAPEVEVIPSVGNLSYEKILTESSLMVTDYSGVQFDFAYMRKPIVYFHSEELPPHYEDGVFFYDTMGFGEICTKTKELVDLLCEYMEHDCTMKEEYKKRADDFFAHDDHNNCERIYREVMEFQKKIDKDKHPTKETKKQ